MLSTLTFAFFETQRLEKRRFPLARSAAAMRVALFPSLARDLRELGYMEGFLADAPERDTFFFVTHKHYLAKTLTLRERIACAAHHYQHEGKLFDARYRNAVYRGQGLDLWSEEVDGHRTEIRLSATEDNRYEGDLSVLLAVDSVPVCRLSYTIVDGGLFGRPAQPMIFITRNQISRCPELQLFRRLYPQNSPPFFCLAAVEGIAVGHAMNAIAAIRAESQIAFEAQYVVGFKNSYCHFWSNFDAHDAGAHGYIMDIPLRLPDLSLVKAEHRRRAQARRRHWAHVRHATAQRINDHRVDPLESLSAAPASDRST